MIANGSSNGCAWWWAQHLQSEDNEKVRIVQSYGLRSENIEEMLNEMMAFAVGTPCKNPFYQMNLNPALGECLTEKDWDRAREIAEEKHGLKGQPYFMVMHTKHGEQHVHLIYSRIDLETGKTISDSFDARKNHAIARQIEQELGLQKVIGPYDLEAGMPRPKRAPKRYESLRAFKSGLPLAGIEAEVTELRQQSQNGQEFKAALARHGYILAHGDKVVAGQITLMIIDPAGNDHSLPRRLHMPSMEVNAFMRDVDVKSLPDIRQAKALQRERKIEGLEADRATVRDEIQREEALAKAAIQKEAKERRFIAPEDRERETRAGQQEKEVQRPQSENLRGAAAQAWTVFCQSDNGKAFAAALDDKGLAFAVTMREEADRSHRESEFAKAFGHYAPRFKEGEIVIVTGPRLEYRREGEIIEPPRVHKLDQSLADTFVNKLDNRNRLQGIDATLEALDNRAQRRRSEIASARLEKATDINAGIPAGRSEAPAAAAARTIGKGIGKGIEFADKTMRAAPAIRIGKAAASTISKPLEALARGFEDLFAPTLTPEQKHEAEKSQHRREAEADHSLDYSRFTAEKTQQQENEREAARQRERDGGGRER